MARTDASEWVSIGRVTAPHGLRGEVRVFPLTDVERRFEQVDRLYVETRDRPGERRPLHVVRVAYLKNLVILGFREITDVEQAEALRHAASSAQHGGTPTGGILLRLSTGRARRIHFAGVVGRVADVLTETCPTTSMLWNGRESTALIPAVRSSSATSISNEGASSSTPFRVFCETGCPSWSLTS